MSAASRTDGAHVVAEHEERAAVRAGAAVQRDAVHGRAHRVLADAEVQDAAVRVERLRSGRKDVEPLMVGVVRLGEVGGAAEQLGQDRARAREHLAGRHPGGHALLDGSKTGARPPSRRGAGARGGGRAAAARSGCAAAPGVRSSSPSRRAAPGRGRRPRGRGPAPRRRPRSPARGRSRGSPWWRATSSAPSARAVGLAGVLQRAAPARRWSCGGR